MIVLHANDAWCIFVRGANWVGCNVLDLLDQVLMIVLRKLVTLSFVQVNVISPDCGIFVPK
jgi:hypothetical protein